MRIEATILSNLVLSEEYARKVLPHTEVAYFPEKSDATLVTIIKEFFDTYNKLPTKEILSLSLVDRKGMREEDVKKAIETIDGIVEPTGTQEWILKKTEEFFKQRALYNAIHESILVIDGSHKTLAPDALPSLLQEALSVCFDTAVGHDYNESIEERIDHYNSKVARIKFGKGSLNKVTKGGLARKSLSVLVGASGAGKTLVMTDFAADAISLGYNVLYISMEMSEHGISQRVDANKMNIEIDDLLKMQKQDVIDRYNRAMPKTAGRLLVKEYPTSGAHSGHFRSLIAEAKAKKNFHPDLIIVDYLGITASAKMKLGQANSYSYYKSVSEELRALGVELDCAVLTAAQVNRGGFGASELSATDTSESMGVVHSADFILGLIRSPDLDELGQMMFQVIKNRWNDANFMRKFIMGLNRPKFKLYDVEAHAQTLSQGDSKSSKHGSDDGENAWAGGGKKTAVASIGWS